MRDKRLLDSALSRPLHTHSHEGCTDLAVLAAAMGFGLARHPPFVDGDNRVAFLAVGDMDEAQFADWIRAHLLALECVDGDRDV